MPKLPTVKPRVVIHFLQRNGFELDHVSGSHFIFYNPVHSPIRQCAGAAEAAWSLTFFIRNMNGIMARKVRPSSQKLSI